MARTDDSDAYDVVETASRDELEALQTERLRWSLAHAYNNVQFYRESFDRAEADPTEVRELADLAKFPFLTKQDMRASYPFGLFAVPVEQVIRVHASSGTTGNPVVTGHTRQDLENWSHLGARTLYAVGARAGDALHMGLVYGLKTGAFPIHYGAEELGCTVIPVAGDTSEAHVKYLLDIKPRLFVSNRSQALSILDEFARQGIDPHEAQIEIGLFGGEAGSAAMRERIAEGFGIRAVEIYGLTEVCGAGMSTQTPESGEGMTIWEDFFYPEIIDPNTGEVLPDGEYGELVITSLAKEACPVIRYRTRDITCILPVAERSMRRLAPLRGRADDIITLGSGYIYPLDIEQVLLSDERVRPFFQFQVSRQDKGDVLSVKVEMSEAVAASDEGAQSNCQRELMSAIKAASNVDVDVELVTPLTFPRGPTKSVRVLDRR